MSPEQTRGQGVTSGGILSIQHSLVSPSSVVFNFEDDSIRRSFVKYFDGTLLDEVRSFLGGPMVLSLLLDVLLSGLISNGSRVNI